MALEPGTTLGQYEIPSLLGAGELYRARDSQSGVPLPDIIETGPRRHGRTEEDRATGVTKVVESELRRCSQPEEARR